MMTENAQDSGQTVTTSAPAEQATQQSQAPQEKLVPQSQVDRIVQERHKAGYEKGKSEAAQSSWDEAKLNTWYQEQRKKEIEQENQIRAQQQMDYAMQAVEKAAAELTPKIKEQGSAKYEDFSSVTADLNFKDPGLLHVLQNVENPADVAYALGKDAVLEDMVMRNLKSFDESEYKKGVKLLNTLAESLKNNEAAKSRAARSPLSTIKPSTTGIDNGKSTISDLRKIYRG